MSKKNKYRSMGLAFLAAIVFITVSFFARSHGTMLMELFSNNTILDVVIFVFLTALFVVFIIPLDIVLLIPIGVSLWGSFDTALFSISGWTIGASIAFLIGRYLEKSFISKFVSLEKIKNFKKDLSLKNRIWPIVLLRMLIPVDILSYAFGMFSNISFPTYIIATIIGVAPFGFIFAYAGGIPIIYQILAAVLIIPIIFLLFKKHIFE